MHLVFFPEGRIGRYIGSFRFLKKFQDHCAGATMAPSRFHAQPALLQPNNRRRAGGRVSRWPLRIYSIYLLLALVAAFCASPPSFARSSTVIALATKLAASLKFEGMISVLLALASSLNAPTYSSATFRLAALRPSAVPIA